MLQQKTRFNSSQIGVLFANGILSFVKMFSVAGEPKRVRLCVSGPAKWKWFCCRWIFGTQEKKGQPATVCIEPNTKRQTYKNNNHKKRIRVDFKHFVIIRCLLNVLFIFLLYSIRFVLRMLRALPPIECALATETPSISNKHNLNNIP